MQLPARAEVFGACLAVREVPGLPFRLHLLSDDVDVTAPAGEAYTAETAPCWPFCWGSGQVLARLVLARPELVRGKRVVDLGTGSGVAAIAAALSGAAEVIAVDLDPEACLAAEANAALARVRITSAATVPETWDVLLASDVLYEIDNLAVLAALLRPGRTMLVADPERPGHVVLPFPVLVRESARTVPDVDPYATHASVFFIDGDVDGPRLAALAAL